MKRKGEAIATRHFDLHQVRNMQLKLYPMGDKACPEGCAAVHVAAPVGTKLRYTLQVGHGNKRWRETTNAVFTTSRLGCRIGSLHSFCSSRGDVTIRLECLPADCTGTVGNVQLMPTPTSYQIDEREVRVEWIITDARAVLSKLRRGQYVRSDTFDA